MVSVFVFCEGSGVYGLTEDVSKINLESCSAPFPMVVSKDLHKLASESTQVSCEACSVNFHLLSHLTEHFDIAPCTVFLLLEDPCNIPCTFHLFFTMLQS